MKTKFVPKPLAEQVVVITGASSGIGLATGKMAAKRGARVVLSSRNGEDLKKAVDEIRAAGGQAMAVVADVAIYDDLEKVRDRALEAYGAIDTWVNNAGISLYGFLDESPLEEEAKLFETNFWGVRHGCRVAVETMGKEGGVIINLGSEVSERSVPLRGVYSASKHAVKAYTDALRIELEKKELPIAVSLIRPAGVDTPFTQHAENLLPEGAPSLPPPVYHPDVVARAILKCAVRPQRDVYVGGPARLFAIIDTFFPRAVDHYMKAALFKQQSRGSRLPHTREQEALLSPAAREGEIRGGHKGRVLQSSLYTLWSTTPWLRAAAALALAVLAARLLTDRRA